MCCKLGNMTIPSLGYTFVHRHLSSPCLCFINFNNFFLILFILGINPVHCFFLWKLLDIANIHIYFPARVIGSMNYHLMLTSRTWLDRQQYTLPVYLAITKWWRLCLSLKSKRQELRYVVITFILRLNLFYHSYLLFSIGNYLMRA